MSLPYRFKRFEGAVKAGRPLGAPMVSVNAATVYINRAALKALGEGRKAHISYDLANQALMLRLDDAGSFSVHQYASSKASGTAVIPARVSSVIPKGRYFLRGEGIFVREKPPVL